MDGKVGRESGAEYARFKVDAFLIINDVFFLECDAVYSDTAATGTCEIFVWICQDYSHVTGVILNLKKKQACGFNISEYQSSISIITATVFVETWLNFNFLPLSITTDMTVSTLQENNTTENVGLWNFVQ